MLSYLDYLVFLQAVFCTEQLYAFRRIIFSMFLRKKKLKITCPFCMGYRLTKWRIFKMLSYLDYLVFRTRFFAQNNSMHSVESFSACCCEKKS